MESFGIRIADWFLSRCEQDATGLRRTKARSSLLVFGLFFVASVLDVAAQWTRGVDTIHMQAMLAQGTLAAGMLLLLKLTGRYQLLVGTHLLASQAISSWIMLNTGWILDPALTLLPARVVIAAYILNSRWAGLLSTLSVALCYTAFHVNTEGGVLLPTGPAITSGTLQMAGNTLIPIFAMTVFSTLYRDSQGEQNKILAQSRRNACRMARQDAIGNMLAELNHHINNPLAILEACFYHLHHKTKERPTGRINEENMRQTMRSSLDRLHYIVNELDLISRGDQYELPRFESVQNIAANLALMTEDVCYRHNTRLVVTNHTKDIRIRCRYHQVIRVLSALVTNACEACEGLDRRVDLIVRTTDSRIDFEIRDSGPGVPIPLEPLLFEPFFTTKSSQSHAGLGLTMARSAVEELGGSISYERLEPGALFKVSLPLVREVSHVV